MGKGSSSFENNFPMTLTCGVKDSGVEFIQCFVGGRDIASTRQLTLQSGGFVQEPCRPLTSTLAVGIVGI